MSENENAEINDILNNVLFFAVLFCPPLWIIAIPVVIIWGICHCIADSHRESIYFKDEYARLSALADAPAKPPWLTKRAYVLRTRYRQQRTIERQQRAMRRQQRAIARGL